MEAIQYKKVVLDKKKAKFLLPKKFTGWTIESITHVVYGYPVSKPTFRDVEIKLSKMIDDNKTEFDFRMSGKDILDKFCKEKWKMDVVNIENDVAEISAYRKVNIN